MAENENGENIGSFYMGRAKPPSPKRVLPPGILAGVTVAALAGIVWYAYPRGAEQGTGGDIPVIKADAAPYKEVPKDPGGMEVRHQDSTIFETLEKKTGTEPETLLPAPEQPVDKAEAVRKTEDAPAAAAATTATATVLPPAEAPKLDLQPKSVPAAPKVEKIEPPKAKVAAPAGDYELQLGSFRDADGLKKDWERLKKKYPEQLGALKMRSVKVDIAGKGTFYRLQAGMLAKDAADAACTVIKNGKGACILVKK